jgi:AraC-like DNA-binding protein
VRYVEHLVGSRLVACTWEQWTDIGFEQRIVPDACVDLIWSGQRLTVAGPDTQSRLVALAPGTRVLGVRLRPGAAGTALGLPASELRDTAADGADVLGRDAAARLLDVLQSAPDPHAVLLAALERGAGADLDPVVHAAVVALNRPGARVSSVAAELGLSARQLQRRVSDSVGYGPKMLARVLRFRRLQALAAARTGQTGARAAELVELALDAGYADQAHMTAEVTRLAGLSPVRFLKDRAPTAA